MDAESRGTLRRRLWRLSPILVSVVLAACGADAGAPASSSPSAASLPASPAATATPSTAPGSPAPSASTSAEAGPAWTIAVSASPAPIGDPTPAWVVVRSGDTLTAIAAAHRLPVSVLVAANDQIADPSRILPGDLVAIPRVAVVVDASVTSDAAMPAGRMTAALHERTTWGDVPGEMALDAVAVSPVQAFRGVVEGLRQWHDPYVDVDDAGPLGPGADVAQAFGKTCEYRFDRQATCGDGVWMFVDVNDPGAWDYVAVCTWPSGVRPQVFEDRWCDPKWDPTGVSRQFRTVGGTFRVAIGA